MGRKGRRTEAGGSPTPAGARACAAWAALLGSLLVAAPAHAQKEPIEPPKRVDTAPVPYPPSGRGHAEAVLVMVVEADGSVASSRVLEGEEPFASAAVVASTTWKFTPALRQGRPVASRVRVRVAFDPPEPPAGSPVGPARGPAPHAKQASVEPGVTEVTVHGVRLEPGAEEMTAAEVREIPGSFGDAFRAIEALPGVTPVVSGFPYFLVRGAPPGDTGFFIDGVRVPALFHVGIGDAVVHPGLIDRVDFYRGGYPARFGRFTGGILSGEVLPTPDHPHAEASLRILDVGGLVSTPFAEGRGDALVSGRYGYPGPVLSIFAPSVGLSYWDYQSRVQWRPTDRDQVGVFAFGSYDSLSQSQNGGPMHELIGYQFHRVDLRWDRKTSPTGRLRVAVTLGYDRSGGSNSLDSTTDTWSTSFVEAGLFGARVKWTDRLADDVEAEAGADLVAAPYHIAVPTQSPAAGDLTGRTLGVQDADFDQTDVNAGVYGELVWRPAKRVELHPGARIDVFSSSGAPSAIPGVGGTTAVAGAVDPRLAARWQITDSLAWISALGIAHQASNIPLPSPGLEFSQLARGLQASYQMSEGVEAQLPAGITATVDGYVHDYTGLADFYETCPGGSSTSCTFNGRSYGLELLVRRALTRRFTGWIAYTLSRTDRDAFYGGHWVRVLSEFDRTHNLNLMLAGDLGKGWRAGARVLAYSGFPYSSTGRTDVAPDSREPLFFRLDARIAKSWKALGGTFTFVIEGLNVLLDKESVGTSCSTTFSSMGQAVTQCKPNAIGPVAFPSIGVEGAW